MGLLAPSNTQSGGLLARSSQDAFGSAADALPINFGTQTSTPSTNSTPDTLGVLKSIGQATARASAAFGATLAAVPGRIGGLLSGKMPTVPFGQDQFVVPNDNSDLARLEQALIGTKEPISFATQGESVPFVPKGASYAPLVGVTAGLLDLVGEGAAKGLTGLTKSLTEAKDVADASLLLRKAGFADDIVQHAAPVFANLTNAGDVKNGLLSLQDLQNTTVRTGEASRVGARSAGEIIGSKPAITGAKIADEVAQSVPTEPTSPIGTFTKDAVESAIGTKERGFITSVKENMPELTSRVAGQYIPRSTDALAVAAKNFIKDSPDAARTLAMTGTDDKAVATAAELIKKYTADAMNATDSLARNDALDKAAEVANESARNLTELGRAVQAASILGHLTPEGIVRFAARSIQKYNEAIDSATVVGKAIRGGKIPEITGEQTGTILTRAKAIEAMPDGIDKARAFKDLMDHISTLTPTPLWKKLLTIWKVGLLTGLKTTGLNTFSNLFHGVTEVIKDIPAAAVDSIASLFTGERKLALTTKGLGGGLKEGLQKGWDYFKTGFDQRDVSGKLDIKKVNFGNSVVGKALQAYEETIFRIVGAEDQPFYYGAKARSLADQAIAMGKNQGLRGKELSQFVEQTIQNPTDEMLRYAVLDAETAVFQNNTALGKVARSIQNIPGAEFVVPFGKTPSSFATQVFNYSPAGIVGTIIKNWGRKFDQRLFSQGIGRGLVGTAIAYIGTELFKKGLIALTTPTTESERNQWKLEGKQQNSVKIGGKWRQVNILGPAGNMLLLGGYLQNGLEKTGSLTGGIVQAAAGGLKSLTDQTFLRGIDDLIKAVSDPTHYATTYFTNLAASGVPTIVGDVARGTDKYERNSQGLVGAAKNKIPGLRETSQPQLDTFGNPIETPGFMTTLLDPSRPTTIKGDAVVSELHRLYDVGYPATPATIGTVSTGGFPGLTSIQNSQLVKDTGVLLHSKLKNLIASDAYKNLDDDGKSKVIKNFTQHAQTNARAAMVLQLTHGLVGDPLKKELSALKKSGLMTQDVFNRFLQIR